MKGICVLCGDLYGEVRLRVAYICTDPGVPVFGNKASSVHLQEFVRALLDLDAEVHLFLAVIGGEIPTEFSAVQIHQLPRLPKGDRANREKAAITANQRIPALIASYGSFDLYYERYSLWSFASMEFARSCGRPAILEVNAPLIEEQSESRKLVHRDAAKKATQRAFDAATAVIAVSREIADYVCGFDRTRGRVHVVPNGVNPMRFPHGVELSLPYPAGSFVIGILGALNSRHDTDGLVRAFSLVHAQDSNARLLVVGDGPRKKAMQSALSEFGLLNAAHFTGAVPPREVPSLLACMDVAVVPYDERARDYFSPLKLFECMAADLPVVAAAKGQIKDVIRDEENGLLYPPGDAYVMAKKILRLRQDPDLRSRLGQAARITVLRDYTWSGVVRRILQVSGIKTAREFGRQPAASI